jgi:hypothetical protein
MGPNGIALGSLAMIFGSTTIYGTYDSDDGTALVIGVYSSNFPISYDYALPSYETSTQITTINLLNALNLIQNVLCSIWICSLKNIL